MVLLSLFCGYKKIIEINLVYIHLLRMIIHDVKELLTQRSETLSVAESLTSGNLQAMIGSVSWASWFFKGWITAYTESMKVQHLSVDQEHAHSINCVSQRVANEMAMGVCKLFDSRWWISTTWYAEARWEVSTPHAYYAIAYTMDWEVTIIDEWKVIWSESMSRSEMQHYVCEIVLIQFLHALKK